MVRRNPVGVGVSLALGAFAAGGCMERTTPTCSEPPTVTIEEPAAGATMPAGTTDVELIVAHLWLVRAQPWQAPDQHGLPGWPLLALVPVAHACEYNLGYVAVWLDQQEVGHTESTEYTLEDVAPGEHTVEVVLHYQDGTPVDPPAADAVTFFAE